MRRINSKRVSALALLAALLGVAVSVSSVYAYSYHDAIVAGGPTLYWPFDDGSGSSVADASGGGHAGGMSGGSWDASGMVSGSTHRVQGNGGMTIYAGPDAITWAYGRSMEFWMASTHTTTIEDFVGVNGVQGGTNMNSVVTLTSAHLHGASSGSGSYVDCNVTAQLDGLPHMVDFTVSAADTGNLYIDGALCASASLGTNSWPTGTVDWYQVVGRAPNTGSFYMSTGSYVGQVSFYGAELASAVVAAHFAAITPPPPANMTVTPGYSQVAVDVGSALTLQTVDSLGGDTTSSDTFYVADGGGMTCDGVTTYPHTLAGHTVSCSSHEPGVFTVHLTDAHSQSVYVGIKVVGPTNRFELATDNARPIVGQQVMIYSLATDAIGNDISSTDHYTIAGLTHMLCSTPLANQILGGILGAVDSTCSWDTAGTYTVVGTDAYGFTGTVTITVTAAPAASPACGGTDVGCYLTQIWNTLTGIASMPGQIIASFQAWLFTSRTGHNYLDVTTLGYALVPGVTCRSGQTPTHPDGTHCLPFPVSLPSDLVGMASWLNVSPVAPAVPLHLYAAPINITTTIDPTYVLGTTVMTYVRDIELVLFILGTCLGTYRIVQAWGGI